MRFFRHVIEESSCSRHCGYHRSSVSVNLSWFHLLTVTTATVPLWLVSLYKPWAFPWYYLFGIFSSELLLLIFMGFLSSLLFIPFTAGGPCKECGSPMYFAGRHFDPLGSKKPHWKDFVIFGLFACANIVIWCALLLPPTA
jgi:hypothetical protein